LPATLIATAIAAESTLAGADFRQASLIQCNLRQTPLAGAQFTLAKLENCDLSEADCRASHFGQANLMGSLFVRTDFRDTDFTDANLMGALLQSQLGGAILAGESFRADLSQAFISDTTRLDGAWTKRIKTLPKRDGEVI
jgi:uncharacterized protein YjbI with pentapeptide repeats